MESDMEKVFRRKVDMGARETYGSSRRKGQIIIYKAIYRGV